MDRKVKGTHPSELEKFGGGGISSSQEQKLAYVRMYACMYASKKHEHQTRT